MINRIYSAVKFITNNEVQGNVGKTEFNIALNNSVLQIYDSYFSELNRLTNRENRGLISEGFGNISDRLREKITYYLKNVPITVSDGRFDLPADCRYVDAIVPQAGGRRIDSVASPAIFELLKSSKHTKRTVEYPVCLKIGNTYVINPATIQRITLYYLRSPKHPNWTSITRQGGELYNPSDPMFQNVDMHPSEEVPLILKVLEQFGINLKDPDVIQAIQAHEQQEFQKNNIV